MVPSEPKCADHFTGKKSALQTGEAKQSVRCESSPKATVRSVGKQPKVRLHTTSVQSSGKPSDNLAKPLGPLAGNTAAKPSRKAKLPSTADMESSSEQKSSVGTKVPSFSQVGPKGAKSGYFASACRYSSGDEGQ